MIVQGGMMCSRIHLGRLEGSKNRRGPIALRRLPISATDSFVIIQRPNGLARGPVSIQVKLGHKPSFDEMQKGLGHVGREVRPHAFLEIDVPFAVNVVCKAHSLQPCGS
jgi:hypothetical protein